MGKVHKRTDQTAAEHPWPAAASGGVRTDPPADAGSHPLPAFVRQAPIGLFSTDPNGGFLFVNTRWTEITGLAQERALGIGWLDSIHPQDRRMVEQAWREAVAGSDEFEQEYRLATQAAQTVWISAKASPYRNATGDTAGYSGFIEDSSRHRQHNKRLRTSQSRLKSLYSSVQAGIILQRADGTIAHANSVACALFGMSVDEITGKTSYDRIWNMILEDGTPVPGGEHPSMITLGTGKPIRSAIRGLFMKDPAKTLWLLINTEPILDARTGRVREVAITFQDITELKLVKEQRDQAAEFYLSILNHSPVLVWRAGTDAKCDWFNATWLAFTGRTLEQELGDGWAQGVHPEDLDRCVKTYLESFQARKPFEMEYRLRDHHGHYRWILDIGTPRETLDAAFGGYIGYCFDITERKLSEEELQRSLVEKTILLKEVHHRVKNNLQILMSLMNLQLDSLEDAQAVEAFRAMQNRVRAISMVHEKIYRSPSLGAIGMKEYVLDLVDQIASTYGRLSGRVTISKDLDDMAMDVDKAIPIGLLLAELVSNAFKHAFVPRGGGALKVSMKSSGDRIVLAVEDDGPGLPEGFSLDSTRSLGVELIKALIRQLKGTVRFASGKGARFELELPANGEPKES